jgi:hypothetical protein
MSQLSSEIRARILAEVRREPSPTRAERTRGNATVSAVGALVSLGLFAHFGFATSRPVEVLVLLVAGCGALSFAAVGVAVRRGGSMLGRSRTGLGACAALAPLALLGFALVAAVVQGSFVVAGGETHQHLVCFALTLLLAVGPFAAALYIRRGTDPVHPAALGAAIGAAAGVCGGALIDLHCTITSVEHLALGHTLPILILTALGALVGQRILGMASRS